MPEISRFFGISIKMFFGDHVPPHFHAEYGEFKAQVNIRSYNIIAGELPPRVLGMVVEWASQHQDELFEYGNWHQIINLYIALNHSSNWEMIMRPDRFQAPPVNRNAYDDAHLAQTC